MPRARPASWHGRARERGGAADAHALGLPELTARGAGRAPAHPVPGARQRQLAVSASGPAPGWARGQPTPVQVGPDPSRRDCGADPIVSSAAAARHTRNHVGHLRRRLPAPAPLRDATVSMTGGHHEAERGPSGRRGREHGRRRHGDSGTGSTWSTISCAARARRSRTRGCGRSSPPRSARTHPGTGSTRTTTAASRCSSSPLDGPPRKSTTCGSTRRCGSTRSCDGSCAPAARPP